MFVKAKLFLFVFLSFLEGIFLNVVLVLARRFKMPYCAFSREFGVVKEAIAWFVVAHHASSVVTERISLQFLVAPYVLSAIHCRILPGVVDEHSRVKVLAAPFLEILESLSELC